MTDEEKKDRTDVPEDAPTVEPEAAPTVEPEAAPAAAAEAEKPAAKPKPKPKPKKKAAPELPATIQRAILKSSPHKTGTNSVPKVMYTVVVALIPACVAAVWFFGIKALVIIVATTVLCVAFEFGALSLRMAPSDAWRRARDGSAAITGILLALNLPSSSPWWLVVVGALVAIVLGKHSFGGLGQNPFNPALVSRVFLLLSFPSQMTTWDIPVDRFFKFDGITGATPLGILSTDGVAGLEEAGVNWLQLFIGNTGGSLGEISVMALLLGAAYMFIRKVISWHIPVSYLGVMLIITGGMWLYDPEAYANPLFHLVSGGLILGVFFMATDMVTTPVTARGMLIFGAGCGLLTAVIRLFGSFPEGVSFAILIMNAFVPLIERRTQPRKFGEVKVKEAKANG